MSLDLDKIDFEKGQGLVVVVAQDARTRAVLMVAFADREALDRTLATGELHFRSRTRGLWKKGETSGNTLRVVRLRADCDSDAILAEVEPRGPTCHTGSTTCWGEADVDAIVELERTIQKRALEPVDASPDAKPSYTKKLLADRNLRLKKLGEESVELVLAIADDDRPRIAEEAADVIYHLMVAIAASRVSMDEVRAVLAARKR